MNTIKLQKKIFSIPNKDKGEWVESYDEKEHGLNRMVHPFRALFVARPGHGKSLTAKNAFLQIQTSDRPFKTVIIVQPTSSQEWDDIDPSAVFEDIPDPETLIDPENGKTLCIIDDFDMSRLNKTQMQRLSMLFRYCSTHCGVSVICSYQSFFDVPPIIRKCCNYFYIWKTSNLDELNIISKRVGYNKKVFQNLFKKYIHDKYDFLLIDTVRDDIRKNIYEVIPKSEYDDL